MLSEVVSECRACLLIQTKQCMQQVILECLISSQGIVLFTQKQGIVERKINIPVARHR